MDVQLPHLLEIIKSQPPELLFPGRTTTETTGHRDTSLEFLGTLNPGSTECPACRDTKRHTFGDTFRSDASSLGWDHENLRKQKSNHLHFDSSWNYILLFRVGELGSLVSSLIIEKVRCDIWPYTGSIWSAHLAELASLSLLPATWVTILQRSCMCFTI